MKEINGINNYIMYDYINNDNDEESRHVSDNLKVIVEDNSMDLFSIFRIVFRKIQEDEREAICITVRIYDDCGNELVSKKIENSSIIKHIDRSCILKKVSGNFFIYQCKDRKENGDSKIAYLNNKLLESTVDRYVHFLIKEYHQLKESEEINKYDEANKVEVSDKGQIRTTEERQKDKVLYSKSFRRMADKAQIFSNRGVHFRNRLSHSLEVANIAKAMAKILNHEYDLNLNLDICDAIALAHDIGHTPFGHVGERAIESFLREEFKHVDKLENTVPFFEFKHNMQGVRVLECLEECYIEKKGIGLNEEVLFGVLGHTKLPKTLDNKSVVEYLNKYFFTEQIKITSEDIDTKHNNGEYTHTVKGLYTSLVSLADEIAQRSHDVDDALASEIIDINYMISVLENYGQRKESKNIKQLMLLIEDITKITNFELADKLNIYRSRISSKIVNEFINSISYNRKTDKLYLGDDESNFMKVLDDLIKNKVICSRDVSLFDSHGERIVKELLSFYKDNILLLPETYRAKITNALFNYNLSAAVDLTNMDSGLRDYINSIIQYEIDIDQYDNDGVYDQDKLRMKEIIIQAIVDYVSGMSDEYAKSRYKEICLIE